MALSSLALLLGLATGATAQTTCTASDTAVTAANPSDAAALAGDCTTLLGLKDALRGTGSLNWANTLSMASWDGITLAANANRVTRISLINQGLDGSIPDLSALTNLLSIDLVGNQLTGSIPDLSALTSLQRLQLDGNQLTGSIPDLSALTSLQLLVLRNNELSGSIPNLSALTSLQSLLLHDNQLMGSIPNLSGLTSLQNLQLNGNQLSGRIPDLSALTSLQGLLLHDNQLSGSIPDLSALTSLERIWLRSNELTGNIPDLSALTSLRELYLHDNQLTGSIPDLSALTSLEWLHLHNNQLGGSIPDLSGLTSLQHLYLFNNQLTGSIPDLSALTSLQRIILSDNQLKESIDGAHFPTSLQWLILQRNQLSGSIPDLSGLSSLSLLYLHQNELTGSIPATLGSVTTLRRLHLAGNPFTGGIPSQLGGLTNLQTLSLCGTDLDASATLPAALETRRTATPPTLTVWSCVRIEDASATEGSPLNFVVEHSTYPVRGASGATGGLTLSYATRDGSAASGADYTATAAGSVTIPANTDSDDSTSSGTVSVVTIDDTAAESAETLRVTLGAVPAVLLLRRTATGTILDNDAPLPPLPPPPPPDPDEDEDGYEDRIESGAPNNGDGNCDGVPDAEQSHVVSFPNARDGRYVTLAVPRPIRLSGIRTLSRLPRGYPPLPPEVTAPIRFLGFYLGGVGRGGEVTVSVYLPAGLEVNSYWQYGPAADTGAPQWYPFGYDGETGARFPQDLARQGHCEARRIELHFIDGARGDDDLRRNGVVASFGAPVLAVPALAPVSLGLPGEEAAVGMALHNPMDADNAVALSVVDGGGETHRQVELEEALAGKGQLARMVCELIDCEPESDAVVIARGGQGHLQGLFMVGDRAGSGRKLDGLSGKFDLARRLFFPLVQSESERATLLFVFNPSLEETDVTFTRYRGDGSLSGTASRTVAGGGFVMETAAGLFGGADEGEQVHVEARARRSLLGFAFLRDEESYAALAAQTPEELPADGSFHAPHFELGAESRTSLYVLSALAGHTTRVRVRAFDNHGHPLGEAERELSRAAGSLLLVSDVGALLQLPPSAQQDGLIEGYLQLDFSVTAGPLHHFAKPRVLGAVEVVRGGNRTVLPLVGPEDRPARSFLQVAHSDRPDSYMFTSLSILNPGPQTAMVTLRVFDPTGRQSAPERILSITPGSRLSGSLEAEWLLDPQFKQVGGHLQVISDRPVISFALFSGRNGQYLSAIASRPGSP